MSLASSIKLLQEFDFVIKRLSEIEQEMEKVSCLLIIILMSTVDEIIISVYLIIL